MDSGGSLAFAAARWRPPSNNRPAGTAEDQGDNEQHQEDEQEDLGDVGEIAGKAPEAENAGDQGEDGKNYGPSKHDMVPFMVKMRRGRKVAAIGWNHTRNNVEASICGNSSGGCSRHHPARSITRATAVSFVVPPFVVVGQADERGA